MFRINEEFQIHEIPTDWKEDFKGSTTIDEFSELFDSLAVKITFFILFIIYETFNNAFYVVVYMFERFCSTGCGVSIIEGDFFEIPCEFECFDLSFASTETQ